MEGVEILKTIEITELQSWIAPAIALSLGLFITGLITAKTAINETLHYCITMIFGIAAFVFIGFALFAPQVPTGEYKQIVRISDNVSINKFYEKYEIISKEEYSNVYTIKERIIE